MEKNIYSLDVVKEYIKQHGRDKHIEEVEDYYIKWRLPYRIFELALIDGVDVLKLEDGLISSDRFHDYALSLIDFAIYVKGADITKLENALIEVDFYKDGSEILEFARRVKGANIEKLEDAMLKKPKEAEYHIYIFAKYVKGANIAKLIKGIQTLEYREELEKILKERENAKDEIDNELN